MIMGPPSVDVLVARIEYLVEVSLIVQTQNLVGTLPL